MAARIACELKPNDTSVVHSRLTALIRKVGYDGGSSSKRMKEGCGFFCDLLDSLSEAVIVAGEIWLFSVESHLRYCLDHVVEEAEDFIDAAQGFG